MRRITSIFAGVSLAALTFWGAWSMWQAMWQRFGPAEFEIITVRALSPLVPGQPAVIGGDYVKRQDCSGQSVWRLIDAKGAISVLGQFPMGLRPPGAYTASVSVQLSSLVSSGVATLSQVVTYVCPNRTLMVRAEIPVMVLEK